MSHDTTTAPRRIDDARLALSLLTIVPTGASPPHGQRTGVAGWFPVVGLFIGALGWGLTHLLEFAGWSGQKGPLVVAAVVVTLWAVTTRLLHWDGLADVADAWWGGHTTERRLEIMKDSHTGAFGSTAVALVAILQVTAIGQILIGHQLPLLLVPVLARLGATFAAWLGTPARADGLGRAVMGRPSAQDIVPVAVVMAFVAAVGTVTMELEGGLFVLIGIVLALVVPHVIAKRMGGVTGDVMGASVLIIETLLFLIAATGLEFIR